jgi:hypothetical protein
MEYVSLGVAFGSAQATGDSLGRMAQLGFLA